MSLSKIDALIEQGVTLLQKQFNTLQTESDKQPLNKQQFDSLIDGLRALVAMRASLKEEVLDTSKLTQEELDALIKKELQELHHE